MCSNQTLGRNSKSIFTDVKIDIEEHLLFDQYKNDFGPLNEQFDLNIKKEGIYLGQVETKLDKILCNNSQENVEGMFKSPLSTLYPAEKENECPDNQRLNSDKSLSYSKQMTKDLFVRVQNDDLYKLQETFIRLNGGIKKENKTKWLRWNNANETKIFGCHSCKFKSDTKYLLLTHMADNHKELIETKKLIESQYLRPGNGPQDVWFHCTKCSYITKTKSSFQNHLLTHKSVDEVEETFRCNFCVFISKYRSGLIKHLKSHEPTDEIYKCLQCKFETNRKDHLLGHIRRIHDSKPKKYKCSTCSFETKYIRSLQMHMFRHTTNRKLYKCPECPFQTHHLVVLRHSHSLVHTSDDAKIYGCKTCPFKTKRKETLKSHERTHKSPDEVTMYKCDVCPYKTIHKYTLSHHRATHMECKKEDRIPCPYCSHQAKSKLSLKQHVRVIHTDPSKGVMHKCNTCTYQTRMISNLRRHALTHMNPKDLPTFQCAHCEYRAVTKDRLATHCKVRHIKEKHIRWNKCEQCEYRTKQKGNLTRHRLVHADPKEGPRFECNKCSFMSRTKNELINHMPKHADVYLNCVECDFKTKYRSTLYQHKKRRHGMLDMK